MAKTEAQSRLLSASGGLAQALAGKAAESVGHRVAGLADRLEGVVTGEPSSSSGPSLGERVVGAVGAVKDKLPLVGGGSSKSTSGSPKATKATNIIEDIDVGVPVRVAYNQWTEFGGFPTFMKKVENVQADEDNKLTWRAQIVWSHRTWEATILEQVPDERIVWRSTGAKGHVDGAVTFHELGPNLTRILVVLEYHPKGLFERTGNLWRAQGRRARVELKHFRRHVMTQAVLDPDSVEGWRGTIQDGEVVQTHEEALAEENDEAEDQYEDDEPEDEEPEEEPEDEYEDEPEDEYEDEEPEDEDEYEPEDEDEDERPRSRRRAS
ncbi:SRPBCC family protein [Pimelobacter simplex]|uniref:SRPBCC family protein n=1 Tax=Nocardioides simplex TaxID=2045 RepID=A0A7J5DZQ4_NOCSI|nr:SRPBCC family protein [Pimelobacter simplex]KAB2811469.1 SRPBCC family protein [Pimelobacter simplex]